jgi:hypothetical protein
MKSWMLFACIAILAMTQLLSAQEDRSKKESWYMYWGLGYPVITYPHEVQELLDYIEDQPGISRTRLDMDLLGIYLPVNQHHTAVGFVINAAGDRLSDDNNNWVQINQYTYGASVMHFFDRNIGDGLFVRGDIGIAKMVITNSDDYSSGSDAGFGFLIGGGYSHPVTSGTRIVLNANYSYRKIEGDAVSKVAFSIGGLF